MTSGLLRRQANISAHEFMYTWCIFVDTYRIEVCLDGDRCNGKLDGENKVGKSTLYCAVFDEVNVTKVYRSRCCPVHPPS